jgi:hypothetical protein
MHPSIEVSWILSFIVNWVTNSFVEWGSFLDRDEAFLSHKRGSQSHELSGLMGHRDSLELASFHKKSIGHWMVCFAVVNFDSELGPKLEYTYPPTMLSESEKSSICFSSFPDSNTPMLEDETSFVFRVTHRSNYLQERRKIASSHSEFWYGFVMFRQKKDPMLRRGYSQRSLVFLSELPYIGLFFYMMELVAPIFFLMGKPALESACQNISKWPLPALGKIYELPFMGNVLKTELPTGVLPQIHHISSTDSSSSSSSNNNNNNNNNNNHGYLQKEKLVRFECRFYHPSSFS